MLRSFLLLFSCVLTVAATAQDNILWYDKPAAEWNHALPVGNGRMGAMVFGGATTERIQLNEESVWAGTRVRDLNPGSRANLKQVQQLLLEEKNAEAYTLTKQHMLGTPPRIRSYQTLGDLYIEYDSTSTTQYRRQLDLSTAVHTVSYDRSGSKRESSVFLSAPDNIMVVHIKGGGPINCRIRLARKLDASTSATGNSLVMNGQIYDSTEVSERGPAGAHLRFSAIAEVSATGGKVNAQGDHLVVSNATELLVRFTAFTDYDLAKLNKDQAISPIDSCRKILGKSAKFGYPQLLARHLAEYQPIYRRLSINLGKGSEATTDQRLTAFRNGTDDPGLIALYYQYGRYLLISSSRYPARLPANLQGKWNHHFDAPWDSDYHTNINLQMNYWPADVANTGNSFEPLEKFMLAMLPPGRECAASMYGAGGWAMHHVTDIYGRTSINADPRWGTSPLAGAWMALTMYDHFDFTRDASYLKRVFPLIKGSADFIMDFLIADKQGQLVTAPSMSPENSFFLPDSSRSVITYAPAIDIQIIRELFACIRRSASVSGVDAAYLKKLDEVEKKLPPIRVNSYGGIMEWVKDYGEVEPGHRHMSHLFGLYPGTTLTRDEQFLNAARATLSHRLANGGGHTGWSRAWMISFYARLGDGNEAYHHVQQLLKKSTHINLFDDHPPFQIDGNFGGTAGISEMLLQSHNNIVHLLPAIPSAWKNGSVKGLRARGGITVDMVWADGKLIRAIVHPDRNGSLNLRYGSAIKSYSATKGKDITFIPSQN